MDGLREQAIQLRNQGHTYSEIYEKLGCSKSTMSYWFRSIELSDAANAILLGKKKSLQYAKQLKGAKANKEKSERQRKEYRDTVTLSTLTNLDRLMAGLYWGEGNKGGDTWQISNMDPEVLKVSLAWAAQHGRTKDEFYLAVSIPSYLEIDEAVVRTYWASHLNFKDSSVKIYRTCQKKTARVYTKEYFGSPALRVIGGHAELFEKIMQIKRLCISEALI